jgi:methionyl aminopeptidase
MAVVKTTEEVEKMRKSARLLSDCFKIIIEHAVPGTTGKFLDGIAECYIRDNGATPAFKDFPGPTGVPNFPASICFSKNHVLVHGIPDDVPIEEGDMLSIDCGLTLDGWCADFARLFTIGETSEEDQRFIDAARAALVAGIDKCRTGNKLGDISNAIQSSIYHSGYENVLQFCGHAIGREMHEEPQVLNFGAPHIGIDLEPGMVFCIEPMLLKHKVALGVLSDKWTVITQDFSRTAHVEHMVHISEKDPEIMSL